MRPDDRDLDEEIRGHLALSVKDRIDRGEDPEAARRAALMEFGYLPAIRDSVHRVWYSRWFDAVAALGQDMRIGLRSLVRAKGLALTVIATLALGIGANAAVFTVVRGVLLRPLVNRGADRLVYIRQTASGLDGANMTFSVPEINDFKTSVTSIGAFGEFSTIEFTMTGLGDPRVVHAGVVNGAYFDVMGLRPVLGRLLDSTDDSADAAGVAVLTHRYWLTSLNGDPSVIGRSIRLGARNATVVGVLEPSVPYPADTEIIANVVTSPHHLGEPMVTGRTHRMTELFGRLAPDVSLERARAELTDVHASMLRQHPDAYTTTADLRLSVTPFRDQVTASARTVLLLLLAAAGVVFVIACSNVANLILARSVRRERELAVRAALGASRGALRRTLLAESLVLCGAGAALGVVLAQPLVAVVSSFAARFSVRALEVTVDDSLLWVGAGLAMIAAVLLAFVPRLPAQHHRTSRRSLGGGGRGGEGGRLRLLAIAQIACSFVLLAGAGMLFAAFLALHTTHTGYNMRQVLAIDLPTPSVGVTAAQDIDLYQEMTRRIAGLPGVQGASIGSFVPWRDAGSFGPGVEFDADGYTPADGEDRPHARFRMVAPGFFAVLGVPLVAGRDFTDEDRRGSEPVAIVSESVAARIFANGDALNQNVWWTDPYFAKAPPRRIVGVVADVDDENVVPREALAIYHPVRQIGVAGRLFVHASGDPYALVPSVTRVIREMSANQPVERAATLEDVRASVLAPQRLNAVVFTGLAGVALLIAVVGVAGVLAFSVSARTHEFGVRLAIGLSPRRLLFRVLSEGVLIALAGIAVGVGGGYLLARLAGSYFENVQIPGVLPTLGAAAAIAAAAVVASWLPAARAARVDVLQALRSE